VLIGDASVGKSNIINNYVKGINLLATKGPTVGLEYSTKTISVNSSHTVKVQIWDTAGQ
jgi:small GTP-binding protein